MSCDGRPLPRRLLKKEKQKDFPVFSGLFLAALALCCASAVFVFRTDASVMDLSSLNMPPGPVHWFGTDTLGRDVFRMIWHGGAVSLFVGLLAAAIAAVIGILYGCLSGISAGWLDNALMRLAEILLSVPSILLVLFIQAMMGQRSPAAIALAIGVTSWVGIAKIVRGEVRQIWQSEAIYAARFAGAGFFYLLLKHLIPGVIPAVMFMLVTNVGTAIAAESTLSFLGLGLPVDAVSWGSMLSLSEKALLSGSWWIIFIPCGFLVATIVGITNFGAYIRNRSTRSYANL